MAQAKGPIHGTRTIRRAVVTGGAGFLGSHLCEHLLARDVEVVCLDNFLTGTPENVLHLVDSPGFRLIRCDVTDYVHVPGPVDLVLHFASPASPLDYLKMPIETLKVGSLGTLHTLGLAQEKDARYVLASTSEVYGDPLQHPQAEDYWGNVNPVGQALDGRPLTVAGDGSQTRSICYVDDTIRGILAMAFSDHAGPVNIGNPDELSMLRLAQWVVELTGSSSPIEYIELPVDDPKVRRPDTTRAEQLLGWRPEVSSEEGLRRTVAWFAARRQAAVAVS
jgi:dTDP-glucose 4,6-dehydratase